MRNKSGKQGKGYSGRRWFSWITILLVLAVTTAGAGLVAGNIRIETDLDRYMPQEHPAFIYSNQAEEWFDIRDGIIIAVEHPESIYNSGTLEKISQLTDELSTLEGVEETDITSLATADNIVGSEYGLEVNPFYRKVPKREEALEELRRAVQTNEMVAGRIVADDGKSTLIVARIADSAFSPEFYQEILDLAESYEGPERLYVAGRPIVEGSMAALGMSDMQRMAPLVILVISLVLLVVLRSLKAAFLTMLVVLISTIWTFALMTLLGVPVYAVSTMIPVMLIAIGVAYGIHLFSQLSLYRTEHPEAGAGEAVRNMVRTMRSPVIMTALTTAVGFTSLITSRVYPVKYFGLFTAFGVVSALFLSLVFLPAGIRAFGLPRIAGTAGRSERKERRIAAVFAAQILRRKKGVLAVAGVLLIVSIFGIGRVWINSSFLDNFERDSMIVRTDRFVNEHFGGTSTLNVILEAQEEGTIKEPRVLSLMSRMQDSVEKHPEVGSSFSLADYLERMNKVMHADREEYRRIPDSRDLVAQYLLLYEMSGDPGTLERVVDYDYRKANVTFQLKKDDTRTIEGAIAMIERFTPEFEKLGVGVEFAGSGYKSLIFSQLILEGQISSLLLSVGIVLILISVMFRSLTAGLIGSVPVVITGVVNFGVMGLLGIPLGLTTALVSSIAVGIGVDYAIHFIERYLRYAGEGKDRFSAAAATMHHSGRAILFNALVVIAGFLVLSISLFPPNRALGALVSLNMFTSFWGTVTVMFVLLHLAGARILRRRVWSSGTAVQAGGGAQEE